jgi:hypothetical protein
MPSIITKLTTADLDAAITEAQELSKGCDDLYVVAYWKHLDNFNVISGRVHLAWNDDSDNAQCVYVACNQHTLSYGLTPFGALLKSTIKANEDEVTLLKLDDFKIGRGEYAGTAQGWAGCKPAPEVII